MAEPSNVSECYFHYCRFGALTKEIQVNILMNILFPLQRPVHLPTGFKYSHESFVLPSQADYILDLFLKR